MNEAPRPDARASRIRWAGALAWAGGGAALIAAGLWFFRMPIADLWLRAALAERGLEADFQIVNLDLDGAGVTAVTVGGGPNYDAEAAGAAFSWRWRGLIPHLTAIRLDRPLLRLAVDREGVVSAGSLSQLSGQGGGMRPSLPEIELAISDGRILIDAPFGALVASVSSSGVLGRDFTGRAELAPTTLPGEAFALEAGQAELVAQTVAEGLSLRLTGSAERLVWDGATAETVDLLALGAAPLDLSEPRASAQLSAARFNAPGQAAAREAVLSGEISATMAEAGFAARAWRGAARLRAPSVTWGERLFALSGADASAELEGDSERGHGEWRLVAQGLRGEDISAGGLEIDGVAAVTLGNEFSVNTTARAELREARLGASARAGLREDIPNLSGAPPGPLLAATEAALDRALARFDVDAPFRVLWSGRAGRIVAEAPIEMRAASGARMRLAPLRVDAPAFTVQLPSLGLHGAVSFEMSGAGLPRASLLLDNVDWAPDAPFEGDGTLSIAEWSAPGASASSEELKINLLMAPQGGGRVTLVGPAKLSGPLADGRVDDLTTALDLVISWGDGWRAAPANGCFATRIGGLEAAGLLFRGGAFAFCPGAQGVFVAGDASGRLSGGFVVRQLALNGAMAGPSANPARLTSSIVTGAFSGTEDDIVLDVIADAARLAIDLSETRTLAASGGRVTARARFANKTWRIDGGFDGGSLSDPSLPGDVTAIAGAWRAAPDEDGEGAVITVSAGAARMTPPADLPADTRPLFNPVQFADVQGVLRDGQVDAQGAILLETPANGLARFTAHHDVQSGVGHANAEAETINFNPELQPHQISELARGVIVGVTGAASGTARLDWTTDTLTSRGRLRLHGLSFATASIPVIENVVGEVAFDDLFELTTPPGQVVRVGVLNPGLAVQDGVVQFQLLQDGQVSIEDARWPFAGGVLAVAPTVLTLGSEETRLRLTLNEVDAAALIARLEVPDLVASGTVEGSFPLRLTSRSAFIEDGVLTAAPGGGVISYVGNAGETSTGAARIAFQALSSFRYDALQLRLSGDISDEIVTSIQFSGHNIGEGVDLASVSSGPGLGNVSVRNAPFRFNVTVTAPFRRLAEAAAGFADARVLLRDAAEGETEVEVDQTTPAPR